MSGFNSDDLVLKQIHICHRHGDRSSEMQVPINKEQNDLENELWKSHILDESTKDRLIKLFPSYGYGLPEKSRNSIYGKLTKNGLNRLIEFGKELNKRYVETNFLHFPLQENEVKCCCTNYQRTYESIQGVLYGLLSLNESIEDRESWFPKIKVMIPNPHPLNPVDSIYWKLVENPQLQEKLHECSRKYDEIVPEIRKYCKSYKKYEFLIYYDYYYCNINNNIPIPKEIEPYKDIVLDECSRAFFLIYQNSKIAKYTMEYYLSKIYYQMLNMKHNFNDKLKCTISAGHDTSILSLLGLFKPELCLIWPKYGSHIIFELYELRCDGRYFVRMLYNFEVVKADKSESEYIPLEEFPKYFI